MVQWTGDRLLIWGIPVTEWISTKAAADYTGYSEGDIGYLLRNGKVEGRRFGRDWFTIKEALDRYLATNPRPGPKPKDKHCGGCRKRALEFGATTTYGRCRLLAPTCSRSLNQAMRFSILSDSVAKCVGESGRGV